MLLTTCACCAAPLPTYGAGAKKCSRCSTRYCGQACQQQHWKEGGHDKLCKKIKRGGGAEVYHADKKYKDAAADAVNVCKNETKGQTCYICTVGAEKEGLVRGCGCRGDSGIAHLSCLVQQAKILQQDDVGVQGTYEWWRKCKLCDQNFEGPVGRALAWACWKHGLTVSYPDPDEITYFQAWGMNNIGLSLRQDNHHVESLAVTEAQLEFLRASQFDEGCPYMMLTKKNLALDLHYLERYEDALPLYRECYEVERTHNAKSDETLIIACECCKTLARLKRFDEARTLYRKHMPGSQTNREVLRARLNYLEALHIEGAASQSELREAKGIIEERCKRTRQVHGSDRPETREAESSLAAFLRDTSVNPAVDADRPIRQGMSVLNLDGAPVLNLDDWRAVADGEGGTFYLPPKSR